MPDGKTDGGFCDDDANTDISVELYILMTIR